MNQFGNEKKGQGYISIDARWNNMNLPWGSSPGQVARELSLQESTMQIGGHATSAIGR